MTRPIVSDMLALAASRRCGQHPEYTSAWGEEIGKLPGLKTFELVLETFSAKKRQLDTVVDCARTWRFPLQGTRSELVHDGRVEAVKSTKPADEDGSSCSTRGNGNGLREQECSGLYIEQRKSRGVREEVFHNGAGVFQDDPGLEGDGRDTGTMYKIGPGMTTRLLGPLRIGMKRTKVILAPYLRSTIVMALRTIGTLFQTSRGCTMLMGSKSESCDFVGEGQAEIVQAEASSPAFRSLSLPTIQCSCPASSLFYPSI